MADSGVNTAIIVPCDNRRVAGLQLPSTFGHIPLLAQARLLKMF
ncbi:MAG: hypothetical protein JWP96_1572 [Polaromonas sp.]|nr:hypothetical protein [Polaromonas sp.]